MRTYLRNFGSAIMAFLLMVIALLFRSYCRGLYIFMYGSVQQPSPFELIISLIAVVAQGISITAFGTSALLMLLAEFASCVSLALGGLIATEGQLSLHVTVSLVGLFWTLFDILSVSYQQDGSGDLDLSSQSGSPFAWAWGILCLLGQWCLLCLSLC